MIRMQQKVINLISKPSNLRLTQEIDLLLPWLRKKNQLFESVQKDVVIDIIRNCQYEHVERDHVIVRQAEKGDCFYFMVRGTASVFIDTPAPREEGPNVEGRRHKGHHEPAAPSHGHPSPGEEKGHTADGVEATLPEVVGRLQKPLDRSKFGKFMIKFESGCCFGEVALISTDCVRNASIIADESTDLLVIYRSLYNHTLKTHQEQEYRERQHFTQAHPLFRSWNPRSRHLLEMSLIKEVLSYDTPIVRQGDPLNGLIIIAKGRAKVQVVAGRHAAQYPAMKPFKSANDVYEVELKRRPSKLSEKTFRAQQSLKQELVKVRRAEGYVAAEKKVRFKTVNLCSVEPGEVIGDIETIMGMPSHMQTVTCTAATEIYRLTAKNYERLIAKKNPGMTHSLHTLVIEKLRSRTSSRQGRQIPLLKHILFKLTEEIEPVKRKMPPLQARKELPEQEALFTHLLSLFVQNKAQLITPHVPGSIYLREIMRSKARTREHAPKRSRKKAWGSALSRSLNQLHPRTVNVLRNDLQQQAAQHRNLENKWLLAELRTAERLHLQHEFQRLKPLQNIRASHGAPALASRAESVRTTSADRLAARKLAAKEANGEMAKQYGVFEMMGIRERHVSCVDTASSKDVEANVPPPEHCVVPIQFSSGSGTNNEVVVGVTKENDDHQTVIMQGRRPSLPTSKQGAKPADNSSGSADPAEAPKVPACSDGALFITEMAGSSKHRQEPEVADSRHNTQSTTLSASLVDSGSVLEYQLLRAQLGINYENPDYRDWETSDSTLGNLEQRVHNFALSPMGSHRLKPVKPPKLARFERGDDAPTQPLPGGRVMVRRRLCPLEGATYSLPNHRHARYYILPTIPRSDELRKAKMLSYMAVDARRQATQTQ